MNECNELFRDKQMNYYLTQQTQQLVQKKYSGLTKDFLHLGVKYSTNKSTNLKI